MTKEKQKTEEKTGLQVKDVLVAHNALESLIKSDKANKLILTSATRIKIAGFLRKTRPVREDYDNANIETVRSLGEEVVDKPGSFRVKGENITKYAEQNKAALCVPTEVKFDSISVADLFGDPDAEAKDQNQVDMDVIAVLQDVGIIK